MAGVVKSLEKRRGLLTQVIGHDCADAEKCVDRIIKEINEEMNKGRKRRIVPPPGGISLREAERKYKKFGIKANTLTNWRKKGWITTLDESTGKVFVSEQEIIKIIAKYGGAPGRGSQEIARDFKKKEGI